MALTQTPGTVSIHDVTIVLEPGSRISDDKLEELTFEVERVLYDHACGEVFSAAVACSFDPQGIEIDLSIPAVSGALVNRRVAEVLGEIEDRIGIPLALKEQKVDQTDAAV